MDAAFADGTAPEHGGKGTGVGEIGPHVHPDKEGEHRPGAGGDGEGQQHQRGR